MLVFGNLCSSSNCTNSTSFHKKIGSFAHSDRSYINRYEIEIKIKIGIDSEIALLRIFYFSVEYLRPQRPNIHCYLDVSQINLQLLLSLIFEGDAFYVTFLFMLVFHPLV